MQPKSALDEARAGLDVSHDELVWSILCREAHAAVDNDKRLGRTMNSNILGHQSFSRSLAYRIAVKLANDDVDAEVLFPLTCGVFQEDPHIVSSARVDLEAIRDRDPATTDVLTPFLYFKGFLALQGHRVAHWLWSHSDVYLARHFQSRISEVLAIDIHPAARMGKGIMLDHGNGLVIGETAVVEDDVSILQDVTLGGTGKETGDRHPKIRRGALIGAGAKILGNIEVGVGAKVGAGSVVVSPVAAHTSVAGVPARLVGRPKSDLPGITMEQSITGPEYVI
ncbi:serine O-acetyltransferase [Phyllobacterium chamaecytisi]|uniref:serine O-acetyltransferase n=1 Tax=Phyllobacterium chamaecytisi TaxID=2876082 RepID=UPI001CCB3890|nr:serine O-acetyltransferase [Phyllobacterium sp. KW56]MBZ9603135.1 serine O-acetyltransferase [Phyllobacterium sp. KW56]